MNTETKNAVMAAGKEAQYDDRAKRLLSQKSILAYILVNTVDEFKGMKPQSVIPYIEGTPLVGVPDGPGLTNIAADKVGQRVIGLNSENSEINEGMSRFDIIFYVRMKDGLSQIIINVEAQKDEPKEYKILNRAVFYVSRLVSSQKERDFEKSDYDSIKRVYSIWICMNMNEDRMSHFSLKEDKVLGTEEWKGNKDLLNIVLIGLSKELPEHDKKHELHRLLGTLLSKELSSDEKFTIMESEYKIPLDSEIREEVDVMCNLSQGIKEEGIKIGEEKGIKIGEEKLIIKMYNKGYTVEEIADVADKSVEEVKTVIEGKESLLV